ncbi:hypothetical protein HY635_02440 [Candidatus Uhrbacteria bacterium]|nr:hypothetical protein [Candidatus Uhrbacteria bacterium]
MRKSTLPIVVSLAVLTLLLPVPILAQGAGASNANAPANAAAGGGTGLDNPLPSADIPTILGGVLRAFFGILGSIALLMFIYGGFTWLTSGGVAEKIKKGQDTMVWAVLGIAITFAAYAIVNFVIGALTG